MHPTSIPPMRSARRGCGDVGCHEKEKNKSIVNGIEY